MEKGIWFDLPFFKSNLNPELFLKWLQIVESIFKYKEIDDEKKCQIATLKFKKFARVCYDNL